MTQPSVNIMRHGDDFLVCVKAQVMTRDDSTGGWVPLGGGGFSTVVLRRLMVVSDTTPSPPPPHIATTPTNPAQPPGSNTANTTPTPTTGTVDEQGVGGVDINTNNTTIGGGGTTPPAPGHHNEYYIHGQRSQDQSVVLNCALGKDVEYTQVNPTFHHWCTEQQRFGLTFQSSADAKAFERGIRRAVDDLLDAAGETRPTAPTPTTPRSNRTPQRDVPCTHRMLRHKRAEVGDDEVFMPLQLPWDRKNSCSQSASTISTTTGSPQSPQSPVLSNMDTSFTNNTIVPPPSANSTLYQQQTQPHYHNHLHRINYVPQYHTSPQRYQPQYTYSDAPRYHADPTAAAQTHASRYHVCREDGSDLWLHSGKPPPGKPPPGPRREGDSVPSGRMPGDDPNIEITSNYSYVHFSRQQPGGGGLPGELVSSDPGLDYRSIGGGNHDYSYPSLDAVSGSGGTGGSGSGSGDRGSSQTYRSSSPRYQNAPTHNPRPPTHQHRDSISSIKKLDAASTQPALPTRSKKKHKDAHRHFGRFGGSGTSGGHKSSSSSSGAPTSGGIGTKRLLMAQRRLCMHCNKLYTEDNNHRGDCREARDCVSNCIDVVSCMCCAEGMLYHCMSDSEGNYTYPCVCDTRNRQQNCRKWTALAILSLLVPCLCCFLPLTACHRCGMACGCMGGRHKPA